MWIENKPVYVEKKDHLLDSSMRRLNVTFFPSCTTPTFSSPSAFPLICSLDVKNKFWRIMLALLAYM